MNDADRVWNRAAMEEGCVSPRAGDRALSALLLVHGMVMNGGVHHALESVDPAELAAGADGYAFLECTTSQRSFGARRRIRIFPS